MLDVCDRQNNGHINPLERVVVGGEKEDLQTLIAQRAETSCDDELEPVTFNMPQVYFLCGYLEQFWLI